MKLCSHVGVRIYTGFSAIAYQDVSPTARQRCVGSSSSGSFDSFLWRSLALARCEYRKCQLFVWYESDLGSISRCNSRLACEEYIPNLNTGFDATRYRRVQP